MAKLQAITFTTSPIYFSNPDELNAYVQSLSGIRVDVLNFNYGDEDDHNDGSDFEYNLGHPLSIKTIPEHNSIIIHAPGGLMHYDANTYDKNCGEAPELTNLLDTVFDFKLFQHNPNLEITLHKRDIAGNTSTETIKMSEYHSKEQYEKRIENELRLIQETKEILNDWNKRLDALKAKHRKSHVILDTITRNNELDTAF